MKLLKQLSNDDCYRTCIAMILDQESPDRVPNFQGNDTLEQQQNAASWLAIHCKNCTGLFSFDCTDLDDPRELGIRLNNLMVGLPVPVIVSGQSKITP